jgi:hypothetical protein
VATRHCWKVTEEGPGANEESQLYAGPGDNRGRGSGVRVEDPKRLDDFSWRKLPSADQRGEVVPARLGHVLHFHSSCPIGGTAHVIPSGLIVKRHLPGHFAPKSPSFTHTIMRQE